MTNRAFATRLLEPLRVLLVGLLSALVLVGTAHPVAAGMAFSVVKVVVPGLENPAGARRRPLGARAISRALDPR